MWSISILHGVHIFKLILIFNETQFFCADLCDPHPTRWWVDKFNFRVFSLQFNGNCYLFQIKKQSFALCFKLIEIISTRGNNNVMKLLWWKWINEFVCLRHFGNYVSIHYKCISITNKMKKNYYYHYNFALCIGRTIKLLCTNLITYWFNCYYLWLMYRPR